MTRVQHSDPCRLPQGRRTKQSYCSWAVPPSGKPGIRLAIAGIVTLQRRCERRASRIAEAKEAGHRRSGAKMAYVIGSGKRPPAP